MAFYSVHVDDDGNEVDSTRQSHDGMYFDDFLEHDDEDCGVQSIRKSSRQLYLGHLEDSYDSGSTNDLTGNCKTVRYVNPATIIENDLLATRNTVDDIADDERSIASTNYSFDQSFANGYSVPFMNSDDSFPSTDTMPYSYRKVCEVTKMIQKPDAYKEWLESKINAKNYEDKKKKLLKEKEDEQKRQKKALSDAKYKEWLMKKEKQKKHEIKTNGTDKKGKTERPLTEEQRKEKERKLEEWRRQKDEQEKLMREKKKEENEREERIQQIRKQHASSVFETWLKTAPEKPKPVPIGQGLFSLKGSIAPIFINPNPWVHPDVNEN